MGVWETKEKTGKQYFERLILSINSHIVAIHCRPVRDLKPKITELLLEICLVR